MLMLYAIIICHFYGYINWMFQFKTQIHERAFYRRSGNASNYFFQNYFTIADWMYMWEWELTKLHSSYRKTAHVCNKSNSLAANFGRQEIWDCYCATADAYRSSVFVHLNSHDIKHITRRKTSDDDTSSIIHKIQNRLLSSPLTTDFFLSYSQLEKI